MPTSYLKTQTVLLNEKNQEINTTEQNITICAGPVRRKVSLPGIKKFTKTTIECNYKSIHLTLKLKETFA